jgi:O-antigen/teichoic acid export membrane protein
VSLSRLRATLARLRWGELGGLAGDSLYMAIWLGAVSVADLVQIALVSHSLGLAEYGRLALVMSVVVLVGQFFDVRVGTAETTFGAGRIASRDWAGTAGVFRFGYLIDAGTGAIGFAVVALTAPFVGPWLVGGDGATLVLLYGLTLLASTVDESSATVLRLMGRFRLLAGYMVALEGLRIAAIAVALGIDQSLQAVLIALVVYDVVGAAVNWSVANRVFSRTTGERLVSGLPSRFAERRAMLQTVFHTNVVSYARIAQVQLPTLLLGALTSTSQVGLYKVGAAAGSIVGRIADPVYASILPRLSRLWSAGKRAEIAALLRSSTPVAAVVVGATLLLVILFSSPILRLIGGAEAEDAVPVLVLVGVGYAVSSVLFWNMSLLFAAGGSGTVSLIAVASAVLQIGLLVPLTVAFEANGAGLAMSVSLVVANVVAAILALRTLRRPPTEDQSDPISSDQRLTATSLE